MRTLKATDENVRNILNNLQTMNDTDLHIIAGGMVAPTLHAARVRDYLKREWGITITMPDDPADGAAQTPGE